MKKVRWNTIARAYIRSLPLELRKEIGSLVMSLQKGRQLGAPQSRPMKVIHKNAFEIRIKDGRGQYRVIYVLALDNEIIIPHAFMKKTQKTPKKEIVLSIQRLKEALNESK